MPALLQCSLSPHTSPTGLPPALQHRVRVRRAHDALLAALVPIGDALTGLRAAAESLQTGWDAVATALVWSAGVERDDHGDGACDGQRHVQERRQRQLLAYRTATRSGA
jgi:hypothetical protein